MVQSAGESFICWGGVGSGRGCFRLLPVSGEVLKLSLQMASAMKRFGFISLIIILCYKLDKEIKFQIFLWLTEYWAQNQ